MERIEKEKDKLTKNKKVMTKNGRNLLRMPQNYHHRRLIEHAEALKPVPMPESLMKRIIEVYIYSHYFIFL